MQRLKSHGDMVLDLWPVCSVNFEIRDANINDQIRIDRAAIKDDKTVFRKEKS